MAGKGLHIVERKRKDGTVLSYGLRWSRGYEPYVYLGTFEPARGANPRARAEKARQRALDVLDLGHAPTPAMFNGGLVSEPATRKRLGEEADKWLVKKSRGWTGEATKRVNETYMRRFVGYFGADRNPDKITLDDVHGFYESLLASGCKAAYIDKLTITGRSILKSAKVPSNPFNDEDLEPPKGKREQKDPLPTIAMLTALRRELGETERGLFDLMLHGGLRPSEACRLTWEQVRIGRLTNFGNKTIPRSIVVLPFQQEAGIDFIPVRGDEPDGYVIGTHERRVDGNGVPLPSIDAGMLNQRFTSACKRAGVSVYPYQLRHLHVSRLHEWAGKCHDLSPRQQADRLGHDLKTAESAYIQALPDVDARAWDSAI